MREVLEPRGADVTSIAMQPGGPQATALIDGVPIVCFPGNPVSTHVSFTVFLRGLLREAAGLPALGTRTLPLASRVRSVAGKRQFARGRLLTDGTVEPLAGTQLASGRRDGRGRRADRDPGVGGVARGRRRRDSLDPMNGLSHVDSDGRARMVDVGEKAETDRLAIARGRLVTTSEVVALVEADGLPKADVLATARIAGIGGAKRTSDLIPLCHPLPLTSVTLDFALDAQAGSIAIEASARTRGRTGVEMEALTAVAVAGLTLHDMVKAVDPAATLTDVQLVFKSGGKRGEWRRDAAEARPRRLRRRRRRRIPSPRRSCSSPRPAHPSARRRMRPAR